MPIARINHGGIGRVRPVDVVAGGTRFRPYGAAEASPFLPFALPASPALHAPMSRRHATPIVFLDFETTGGVAAQDRIIEIGLVRVEDGKPSVWQTLVNPGVNIPAIVTTVTGLK